MDIQTITKLAVPILKRYGVTKAALFGSVVRGEATETSDVDILVELSKESGFSEYVDIQTALEESIGKKVDLIEYDAIKPRLKPYIMHDAKQFFSQQV